MLKCSSIMYCFELDNTICDCGIAKNFLKRFINIWKSKICIRPSDFDIRWNIITNRPWIDKSYIKTFCVLNGLAPCDIITYNKLTYPKKDEFGYLYKLQYFYGVLDGKIKTKYTTQEVKRVFHISNNQKENYFINSNKNSYPIVSCDSIDFKREFFNSIM